MNSKFRGTLLGVLAGDCCGALFEGESFDAGHKLILRNFLKRVEELPSTATPRQKYTDDTAMTKSVAKCLLNYDPADYQKKLAVNFVKEYFTSPSRGYGAGVVELFHELRKNKFEDFLGFASQQFNGRGSFGNGAAMRISPVALFCFNKPQEFLIELVRKTSVVTHSNVVGVNGAILQAVAIQKNLNLDPRHGIDVITYIDDLLEVFSSVERGEDEHGIPETKHYTKQMMAMKYLFQKKFPPSNEEVVNVLGHSVNALYSVPTAIYCFLRSVNVAEDKLRTLLEYTISLGGDTDTIASMACALSGAFHGDVIVKENMIKQLESSEEIIELADQLCEAATT